ncbi:MAG: hypothetical protein Kow0088_07450 [Anaerolineales bacterium]
MNADRGSIIERKSNIIHTWGGRVEVMQHSARYRLAETATVTNKTISIIKKFSLTARMKLDWVAIHTSIPNPIAEVGNQ